MLVESKQYVSNCPSKLSVLQLLPRQGCDHGNDWELDSFYIYIYIY